MSSLHARLPQFELELERRRLVREADLALNRALTTFEAPPQPPFNGGTGIGGAGAAAACMRVLFNGELVRAVGFEESAVFVQYEVRFVFVSWETQ